MSTATHALAFACGLLAASLIFLATTIADEPHRMTDAEAGAKIHHCHNIGARAHVVTLATTMEIVCLPRHDNDQHQFGAHYIKASERKA